jgi:hypothetical protein
MLDHELFGRMQWWYNKETIILFVVIIILQFNSNANGLLPDGSGTTMRHNTQKYTYHTT